MPIHGATCIANGKRTLSDNEILAYSRNRYAERRFQDRVQRLGDEEHTVHDRHHREVAQWRDFRRQSMRTSGVWSRSFDEVSNDDLLGDQRSHSPQERGRDAETGHGRPSIDSPRSCRQRSISARKLSGELSPSIAVHSEVLSKFQRPWVYTFSDRSYNTFYNEAAQLGQGQQKRLYLRRASSACSSSTPNDQLHDKLFLRSRSSMGDVSSDVNGRPLTDRSTPGTSLGLRSRCKLSSSNSPDDMRPNTSMGLLRTTKNQETTKTDKGHNRSSNSPPETERHDTAKQEAGLHDVRLGSVENHVSDTDTEVSKVSTKRIGNAPDPTWVRKKLSVTDKAVASVGYNLLSTTAWKETETHHNDHEDNSKTAAKGQSQLCRPEISLKEPSHVKSSSVIIDDHEDGLNISSSRTDDEQNAGSQILQHHSNKQIKTEKRVHISPRGKKVDKSLSETDRLRSARESFRTVPSGKDKNFTADSLKGDNSKQHQAAPTPTSSAPPSSPTKTEKQAGKKEDHKRPTSVNKRRGSDVGALRQRGDMTSGLAGRVETGALSRRYSAIDTSRRGSFMKIVDHLEALQEHYHQRMIGIEGDGQGDVSHQNQVSRSPNEANANPTGRKEIRVKDTTTVRLSVDSAAVVTDYRKTSTSLERDTMHNRQTHQNLDKSECLSTPRMSETCPAMTENQAKKKTELDLNKTKESKPQSNPNTEQSGDPDETCEVMDKSSSSRSPSADSDCVVFRGCKIHNYIRPQERYRSDSFLRTQRERTVSRLSLENPVSLKGRREETQTDVIFPKASRQKVLKELVHRNNQPHRAQDGEIVSPELRTKIEEFFKTIEPYCSKPDVTLE